MYLHYLFRSSAYHVSKEGARGFLTHSDFFCIFGQGQSRYSDVKQSNKSFQVDKDELEVAETAE